MKSFWNVKIHAPFEYLHEIFYSLHVHLLLVKCRWNGWCVFCQIFQMFLVVRKNTFLKRPSECCPLWFWWPCNWACLQYTSHGKAFYFPETLLPKEDEGFTVFENHCDLRLPLLQIHRCRTHVMFLDNFLAVVGWGSREYHRGKRGLQVMLKFLAVAATPFKHVPPPLCRS